MSPRRRARLPGSPALCGWCASGHHLPREAPRALGCTRYQAARDADGANTRHPCPCTDPSHEETP